MLQVSDDVANAYVPVVTKICVTQALMMIKWCNLNCLLTEVFACTCYMHFSVQRFVCVTGTILLITCLTCLNPCLEGFSSIGHTCVLGDWLWFISWPCGWIISSLRRQLMSIFITSWISSINSSFGKCFHIVKDVQGCVFTGFFCLTNFLKHKNIQSSSERKKIR